MFVGHLGVGFVAASAERRVPLWAWIGASFVPDLLWPLLLLAGVEQVRVDPGNTRFTGLAFDSYPWSHSLALALAWGAIAAVVAALGRDSFARPGKLFTASESLVVRTAGQLTGTAHGELVQRVVSVLQSGVR